MTDSTCDTGADPILLRRFFNFVCDRQAIWYRRSVLNLPRPWTVDPTLERHHFTNVYRELDPGTAYVSEVAVNLERADAVFFTIAYRLVNRRDTFTAFPLTPVRSTRDEWLAYLDERFTRKLPVNTRRHLTPSRAQYRRALADATVIDVPRVPADAWRALRSISGVGAFLGWQVFCDLVQLGHVDFDPDFIIIGDGAAFALAALFGEANFADYAHSRVKRVRVSAGESQRSVFATRARWVRDVQDTYLTRDKFYFWNDKSLDLKNIEHALCEWLRYERLCERLVREK